MKERRNAERFKAWFPMRVQATEEGGKLAVSRNISRTGMLIATAATLEVGAPVSVRFRMEPVGPNEHTVAGTIVRFEDNDEDPGGLWPYMVAVEFDEPDAVLEAIVSDLDDKGPPEG